MLRILKNLASLITLYKRVHPHTGPQRRCGMRSEWPVLCLIPPVNSPVDHSPRTVCRRTTRPHGQFTLGKLPQGIFHPIKSLPGHFHPNDSHPDISLPDDLRLLVPSRIDPLCKPSILLNFPEFENILLRLKNSTLHFS